MDFHYYRKDFFSIRNEAEFQMFKLSELPKRVSVRVKILHETDRCPRWRIGKQSTFVYDLQWFVSEHRTIHDMFALLKVGLGDGGISHAADEAEPVVELWGDQAQRLVRLLVTQKIVASKDQIFVA